MNFTDYETIYNCSGIVQNQSTIDPIAPVYSSSSKTYTAWQFAIRNGTNSWNPNTIYLYTNGGISKDTKIIFIIEYTKTTD